MTKLIPNKKSPLIIGLLASSMLLAPMPASAQDRDTNARLDRLEKMLAKIMQRLDKHEEALSVQEIKVVEATARVVEEVKAVKAEQAQQADAKKSTDGFYVGDSKVTFSGYTKLDVIATRFSDGTLGTNNLGRDFYIPALVPVRDGDFDADWVTDFNIRETRFAFKTETPVGEDVVTTFLDLDFQVTSGGDERISNSYVPRVRNAFISYKGWTIGQAWSTFQDVTVLPDNLDFIGPSEGTAFERQPLIRYKTGNLELALEQPETAFTDPNGGARILSGSDPMPDIVARYSLTGDWGFLRVAGILRTLNKEAVLSPFDREDSTTGYGVSVSGKLKVGARDDFRFMGTAGEGLGRYLGLNLVNGAAVDNEGRLRAIPSYAGFASYRHFWRDDLRSNLTFSYFRADNPVRFTGDGVTDQSLSIHANLIYTPVKKFDLGLEYILARRELENGLAGYMDRVQFSAKFKF